MRVGHLFAATSFPLLSFAAFARDVKSSEFKSLLEGNELVVAAFTSNALESLRLFDKIFDQTAEALNTPLVRIDCDSEVELCKEYDVNAYPAVRLFKKSMKSGDTTEGAGDGETRQSAIEVIRYRGKKTRNAIESFVTKHELPVLTHVPAAELPDFKKIDNIVVVAYLRSDQSSLLETFRSVAEKKNTEYVFGYVTDTDAADKEGLAMPSVVCYKNTDGDNKAVNGHFKGDDVEKLLEAARTDMIGEFSEKDVERWMQKGKLTIYIFVQNEEEGKTSKHELTPLAKTYAQYTMFALTDAVEYAPMAQGFGLKDDVWPALAVHAPMNDNVFLWKQGKTIERREVEHMLKTILQGKAVNGQVFGDGAHDNGKGHDEL